MELHPILEQGISPASDMWYVVSAIGDRPSLRVGHTCLYSSASDRSKGKVYVLGGANPSETFTDVHILDLHSMSWNMTSPEGFKSRYEHVAFIPSSKPSDIYVLSGANQEGNLSEIQSYNIQSDSWSTVKASGAAPTPRTHHTTAVIDDCVYIFSGGKTGAEPVQDRQVYSFNALDNSWSCPAISGELPPPRHGHTLCTYMSKLICFGGMASTKFYNDLYILDLTKNTWTCPKTKKRSLPEPRAAHAATVHDKFMYVFGGMNKEGMALDDLWKLDLSSMQWAKIDIQGPPPPSRLDMACCVISWTWGDTESDLSERLQAVGVSDQSGNHDGDTAAAADGGSEGMQPAEAVGGDSGQDTAAGGDSGQDTAAGGDSGQDTAAGGDSNSSSDHVLSNSCHMLLIHGGMDTQGEIFDDCLVIRLG